MEIRNVIELSAFSKSLSKKITYLNHKERILIDIEQIAAITPSSEREDLPKKVGLASCNNDEAKEELYTCVLLKCGFSVRVIESVEEVYNKIQKYTILLFSNKNQFYLKCEAKEKWRLYVFARRMLQSKKKKGLMESNSSLCT